MNGRITSGNHAVMLDSDDVDMIIDALFCYKQEFEKIPHADAQKAVRHAGNLIERIYGHR